jgi:hypothetical protein
MVAARGLRITTGMTRTYSRFSHLVARPRSACHRSFSGASTSGPLEGGNGERDMPTAHEDEIADLRARLVGLRMFLHARRLRVIAGDGAGGSRADDLVEPVLAEIAEVKARLHSFGVPV